jgi:ribosome maturation factor RimP
MDRQAIVDELKSIIQDFLLAQGLDLVDLILRYEGRDLVLRILADKPEGGISLGECANLNIQISQILDEKDILKERYILEVSSPGLDRPLKTKSDFRRCLNRRARFFLKEAINGKVEIEGIINRVEEDLVCVDIDGGLVQMPLSKIAKAKQVLDNIKLRE